MPTESRRAWLQEYRRLNPDKVKQWSKNARLNKSPETKAYDAEKMRLWRIRNIERVRASARACARRRTKNGKNAAYMRIYSLKIVLGKYRLTPESFAELLKSQGDVCAICKHRNKSGRRLVVDHDHSCCPGIKTCGKCVRGLLCNMCNHGLGHMRDNIEYLEGAIAYLRRHGK